MPIISESVLLTLVVALPAGWAAQGLSAEAAQGHDQRFQSDQGIRLLVTGVGRNNLTQISPDLPDLSLQRSRNKFPGLAEYGHCRTSGTGRWRDDGRQ